MTMVKLWSNSLGEALEVFRACLKPQLPLKSALLKAESVIRWPLEVLSSLNYSVKNCDKV